MIKSKVEQNDQTIISEEDQIGEETIIDDSSEIKWILLGKDEVIPIKKFLKSKQKVCCTQRWGILNFFILLDKWVSGKNCRLYIWVCKWLIRESRY